MSGKGKIGPSVLVYRDGTTDECDVTIQCAIGLDRQWQCPFGSFFTDPPEEGERCQWYEVNGFNCNLPRARLDALRRLRRVVTNEIDELETCDGCE